MKALLLAALTAGLLAGADDKEVRYADHGIAFKHPKDWKVKTDAQKGFVTVTVQNDKGTQALVQLYAPETDPKLIQGEMDKAFRKAFEGKLVEGSDKPAKRKLLGAERDGLAMEFEVAKDVKIKLEVFAFAAPSKQKTVCVVFQQSTIDADAAKAAFTLLADSLEETKDK